MEPNTLLQADDLEQAFSPLGKGSQQPVLQLPPAGLYPGKSEINNTVLSDCAHSKYIKYNSIHLEHSGGVIVLVGNAQQHVAGVAAGPASALSPLPVFGKFGEEKNSLSGK